MTEHSLEELKRQLDAAVSKRLQAQRTERDAEIRYCDAVAKEADRKAAAAGYPAGCKIDLGEDRHAFLWGTRPEAAPPTPSSKR